MAETQTDAAAEPTAEEISADEISEQKAVRLAKRERLIAASDDLGLGAYPVRLPITATIPEVRDRFVSLGVDEASGEQVGLAGRVVYSRNTGKLCFATLQSGDGSRIQAMVSLAEVGEESLADVEGARRPGRPRVRGRRGHHEPPRRAVDHGEGVAHRLEGDPAAAEPAQRAVGRDADAQPVPRPDRARAVPPQRRRPRQGQREPPTHVRGHSGSSRSRRRCCRSCTAGHPLGRS